MKLLDICKIGGKSIKEYRGLKKYVATGDVINNTIVSFENVSFENKPSRANVEIGNSDVLFAKMKDTIKTLCANNDNINNIYSTGFYALKPNNNVMQKYLYYYLNSESFNTQKNRLCSGATQKALNNEGLGKIIIKDIPARNEQEKIIDRLTMIDNLINLKNNQINKLELLVKSQFVEMFERSNNNIKRLGDVCTRITDGTHKTPLYQLSGVTFISARNIVNEKLDLSDVKYISESEYNEIQNRCQTEKGDVLLSKSGSLGIPVVFDKNIPVGLFESLAVIKYDRDRLNGRFLCEQLKCESIQKQFKSGTKGVAIKHLHLNILKNINIIVPPIELQNKFAQIVEQIDKQKFEFEKNLKQLEEMKSSLMQEYFG